MKAPRGFKYGLEPVRVKSEWDLLELQQHLAECLRTVSESRSQLQQLASKFEAERKSATPAGREVCNVHVEVERMRRSYIDLLAKKLNSAEDADQQAQKLHAAAVSDLKRQQRLHDGIEQHRLEKVQAHLTAETTVLGREADDAWSQRKFYLNRCDERTMA